MRINWHVHTHKVDEMFKFSHLFTYHLHKCDNCHHHNVLCFLSIHCVTVTFLYFKIRFVSC